MKAPWSPLLTEPPAIAGPLLAGVRRAAPALFEAALQAPESPSGPVSATLDVAGDPAARIVLVGRGLRRARHGPRESLLLNLSGEAYVGRERVRVAGDIVLDLATRAILRLRLVEPVAI